MNQGLAQTDGQEMRVARDCMFGTSDMAEGRRAASRV